ncbi:Uncharacterised protein [Mycobacteroides abscessus subsp. abscessus]|nr:Uncharacterised protein [Mycobacteroides abscessus subsp. abscessus]
MSLAKVVSGSGIASASKTSTSTAFRSARRIFRLVSTSRYASTIASSISFISSQCAAVMSTAISTDIDRLLKLTNK